jgi:cerevisin
MKFSILSGALLLAGYATAIPMVKPTTFSDGYVAPLYAPAHSEAVAGSYIVVLKSDLTEAQLTEHAEWINTLAMQSANVETLDGDYSQGVEHVYEMPNLKGYAGRFDKRLVDAIRKSDQVYISI